MFTIEELQQQVENCRKCGLHANRINTVLGEGNISSKLMFVGEAPGADEDRLGRPFVGKAGQLLDKGLNALNFHRNQNYYICNVCKCRPDNNRVPAEEEAEACLPYLRNQVYLMKPRIIVCLGSTASKYIIDKGFRITTMRGQWIERKGYFIMPTFHPAAMFRDESKKILFWQDLKKVREKFDELGL